MSFSRRLPRRTHNNNPYTPFAPFTAKLDEEYQDTHLITLNNTATMHRTYSMRQSRAPTASQIQNPPPPSATTKTGRLFGKANIGM
jgi:hypothetical protein